MVEVEDLNHYGVGLFDFASGTLVSFFLARLTARSKGTGQGRSALCIPHINNQNINTIFWLYQHEQDE